MLAPGSSLGPYQVIGTLGAGGMGVVHRAFDPRLKRNVALKVLPAAFSTEPARVQRFQREAQMLAALSHPHIASLYGLEESDGTRALVMELVDGETVTTRLARGPIPVREALALARQLVEALDYAHERGILHRDLKPDNLMLTEAGDLKVLDFGLAMALEPHAEGASLAADALTTRTSPGLTSAGVVLGTAAYMAPEQARGKAVDKRADIWAFGCVLFEMLAGLRLYQGETVTDVLAAVMTQEPDLSVLPAATPKNVVSLIRHCLEKDPRRRLRDIAEATTYLDANFGRETAPAPAPPSPSRLRSAAPWALTVVALAIAAIAVTAPWRQTRNSQPTPAPAARVEAAVGADVSLVTDQGPSVALSPDASMLAFIARKTGQPRQVYVRRLDQLEATALAGTEDALVPGFSPDGQWVAFFAGGKLKKVPVVGGQVVVLCDAPTGRGLSWGDDGWIVFIPNASGGTVLHRVSASGGPPSAITTLRDGEASHRWPQVLPGARAVLYSTSSNLGNYNDGTVVVQPLPSGGPKEVVRGGHFGRYLPSGHITYVHDGRLFAVPFDVTRLELTGDPIPVVERVSRAVQTGSAQFDVSANGTAVYIAEERGLVQPLQWLSRKGTITTLGTAPFDWSNPRIALDGQRVVLDRFDGLQTDIWVYDLARDAMTQVTFDPGEDWSPLWTPDGARITFRSTRRQFAFNLHWQRASGVGEAAPLTAQRNPVFPVAWHPRGDVLAYVENNPATNYDIMILPLNQAGGEPGPPRPFLNTAAQEMSATFSPDGRWIAYVSNESGKNGIYVRPYPGPAGQWLVAPEGTDPTWSRTQPELVFLGPDQRLMVSTYSVVGDSFLPESPRPWSTARAVNRPRGLVGFYGRAFDLHPDGERVLGAWTTDTAPLPTQNTVILAFNFFDELRRLASPK